MKLLIVESPSKTKKIAHYLGAGWQVEASFGHVRDLPVHDMGVSAPDYEPAYEIGERSKNQVAKLKMLAKDAAEIWLATDPDREGEAIAWHLNELLGRGKTVKRVTFNEITESAVKKAIAHPRKIDMDLVMAQQGRRVLDRLYGYKISPLLSTKLCEKRVSAGRVQSVALKLIVEREQAIRNFVATEHFGVCLNFTDGATDDWQAVWKTETFITDDYPYITDKHAAQIVQQCAENGVIVKSFNEVEHKRKAPPPLITSTMQQAAANKLKMSVSDTMKAAQTLFEAGLITYMRTDNPNLSDEAISALHTFLINKGQAKHIAKTPNKWKAKDDAQESHEAIRPTDFNTREANTGDSNADKLYQLIWRTAVACQMADATYKMRKAVLETLTPVTLENVPNPQTAPAQFIAKGSECIYKGWQMVMRDDYTNEEELDNNNIPNLIEGQTYIPTESQIMALTTRPPRRYSETSLVKALERHGIGRPATYANIIETQLKRQYAVLEKRLFKPTALGEAVSSALDGRFAIMDTAYTAEMESQLDAVAQGRATYCEIVGHYDNALNDELADFTQAKIKPYGNAQTYPCLECETGQLRKLKGKNGAFWGCSNYQAGCKCTRPDDKGKPGAPQNKSMRTEYLCPECKKGYLQRYPSKKKKNAFWWGCSEYRSGCTYTTFDNAGKPK